MALPAAVSCTLSSGLPALEQLQSPGSALGSAGVCVALRGDPEDQVFLTSFLFSCVFIVRRHISPHVHRLPSPRIIAETASSPKDEQRPGKPLPRLLAFPEAVPFLLPRHVVLHTRLPPAPLLPTSCPLLPLPILHRWHGLPRFVCPALGVFTPKFWVRTAHPPASCGECVPR